ncbi:MAG: ferredoxin, partial [Prevotella sp.]|nr:ferredoxin [Prevotella sp.]
MRKVSFILAAAMLMVSAAAMAQQASKVYLTREISPESLVKIYKALGVEAKGRVAVKMSTGEGSNPNYLKPELVKNLIWEVDGTIVEC